MLRAILIDDEKNSRDALQKKLQAHCPSVTVTAVCSSGQEGAAIIRAEKPDLVFLDIEMPGMNGFAMLESLPERNFSLVFTTAFNQYAINAIRYGAFDYLVKPVEVEELKAVVERALLDDRHRRTDERLSLLLENLRQPPTQMPRRIAVAVQDGLELVPVDQIIYLEALSNYTQLHFVNGKPLLASRTLKEFEELLEGAGFFRIHNASLVNLRCVRKYIRGEGGQVLLVNDLLLDVARRRKDELLEALGRIAPRI
jgi:two-component system LytT family response regulator